MRCVPQVHGIVNDTIEFVKGIIHTEINSALDNPVSETPPPLHHRNYIICVTIDGTGHSSGDNIWR